MKTPITSYPRSSKPENAFCMAAGVAWEVDGMTLELSSRV